MSREDALNKLFGLGLCSSIEQCLEVAAQKRREEDARAAAQKAEEDQQKEADRQEKAFLKSLLRGGKSSKPAFLAELQSDFPSVDDIRAGRHDGALLEIGLQVDKKGENMFVQVPKDQIVQDPERDNLSARAGAAKLLRPQIEKIHAHLRGGKATPPEREAALEFLIELACRCLQAPPPGDLSLSPQDFALEHVLEPWVHTGSASMLQPHFGKLATAFSNRQELAEQHQKPKEMCKRTLAFYKSLRMEPAFKKALPRKRPPS
jgi:hypothetical protein